MNFSKNALWICLGAWSHTSSWWSCRWRSVIFQSFDSTFTLSKNDWNTLCGC